MNNSSGQVIRTAEAVHTTHLYGIFTIYIYETRERKHVALVKGDVKLGTIPVRVQSACLTGTALNSVDCECHEQLEGSLAIVSQRSNGIILYMDEEGRGHGLTTKIRALANKNRGLDTFEAVKVLGKPPDIRDYQDAASILKDLGVASVQLITNNPQKISELSKADITITDRIPIEIKATKYTKIHLQGKKAAAHFLKQPL